MPGSGGGTSTTASAPASTNARTARSRSSGSPVTASRSTQASRSWSLTDVASAAASSASAGADLGAAAVAMRVGQGRADLVAAGRADPEKGVDDHPVRVGAPRLAAPGVDLLARPAHVAGAGQLGQDRAVGEAARQPQRPWPAHARQDRRRAAGWVVQAHLVQVDVGAVRSDRLAGQ
jgi:hypothetical protein